MNGQYELSVTPSTTIHEKLAFIEEIVVETDQKKSQKNETADNTSLATGTPSTAKVPLH